MNKPVHSADTAGKDAGGGPLHQLEQFLAHLLFQHRKGVLILFSVLTVLFAWQASSLRPSASFEKMIPTRHPAIVNYLKHEGELRGLGNVVRVIVQSRNGDIFTREFQEVLRSATDEIFYIPGVDRAAMRSVWTPNVLWGEVTEEGFEAGPVIPQGYDGSMAALDQLRLNVYRSGEVGSLVANDFKSALILVPLLERNPDTGEALDYARFSKDLEEKVRRKYQNADIEIRIVGFAKVIGELIDGAVPILGFFGLTLLLTAGLLYYYSRCARSTATTIFCCLVAVVWQLGCVALMGYGLDPYSILVPFLTFAIGISHAVQNINATALAVANGAGRIEAAKASFRTLFVAGTVALLCDAVGFATLLIIDVGVIKELAIAASIGVAVIIFTKMFLLPVLMSYTGVSPAAVTHARNKCSSVSGIWRAVARCAEPKTAVAVVLVSAAVLAFGFIASRDLRIGDLDPGAPELRKDSRYNRDVDYLVTHYATSTDMLVVMTKTPAQGCRDYQVLAGMDLLAAELEKIPSVQRTQSVSDFAYRVLAGNNEGNLKWYAISRNKYALGSAFNKTPKEYIGSNCAMTPFIVYLNDHKAETLSEVMKAVRDFSRTNDSEQVRFVLAGGNAGIEAATNEVIKETERTMLLLVYGIVGLLLLLEFRSFKVMVCIIVPLYITSVLCEAIMARMGLGVKVATLPVIALGVGIGVDYGIYIYNRLQQYMEQGYEFSEAYARTLMTTGRAVAFTGLTLAVGVLTWIGSEIKFQADMGLLLTFMFLWNMVGALVLLPALARLILVRRPALAGVPA
ncbi:efflux RND transporter permease subunit [Noviherbaspirillum sp. ST9]|uniref:efflux RND transporter permease subunit n=1 Tax=Noviherbaspirillum sp. ST9 TaxID=3401606 RepID=UPI003B58A017